MTQLSTGENVEFYGREYRIRSCDDFTREFLRSEGLNQVETNEEEAKIEENEVEFKSVFKEPPKLKKFLQNDGKVLR